jgi:hypothetical protein
MHATSSAPHHYIANVRRQHAYLLQLQTLAKLSNSRQHACHAGPQQHTSSTPSASNTPQHAYLLQLKQHASMLATAWLLTTFYVGRNPSPALLLCNSSVAQQATHHSMLTFRS